MGDIRALGYLTIDTTDLDRWRTLAHDVVDLGEGACGDADPLLAHVNIRLTGGHRYCLRGPVSGNAIIALGGRQ
ncbi:hypothetical protein [Dietzia massiliensis]|uniref:hypothetical protein n=1 Tax=Dietzia massiliensis TaxID=2697499 RepID=UPI001BD18899|nr:hypothetical protein [Dietzia massiliensis]MBS7546790.1 hypothetical protein [Dietzia massiliensis]